ncbi:MAG: NPCBM/NEW2 domain-containing protein [Phycisphaerae bacterium]|nr:NPCBM/NEW2 domain-containing protein [Phycisphaerae bacterium]
MIWCDGSICRVDEIPGWRAGSGGKLEALDVTFKRPTIKTRRLFDPKNPAMMLCDTTLKSRLAGPFVEFANGDILPGRIVENSVSEHCGFAPMGAAILVSGPLISLDRWRKNVIRVRSESIARIVGPARRPGKSPILPGQVVLSNGAQITAKDVIWRPDGLRILTGSGVRMVTWDQIAEFRRPRIDRKAELLRDMLICKPVESDFFCRMTATNGAVLTYHCRRIQSSGAPGRCLQVVQPSWAMDGICVSSDHIVFESYRRTDEIPLGSLPAKVLAQRSMTGFNWSWRRNCGFHAQQLASGRLRSDLGVGMHSYSEIAFELPKGSLSFSSWVGIDRSTKKGGCVRCRIHLDDVASKPVWTSGFMLGASEPVRVELPDLRNAKRLVLVVEFAHKDRPDGADPLDIRDEVSWLRPMVKVDRTAANAAPPDLFDRFPELAGWSISPEMKKRITVRPFYDARRGKWFNTMVLDAGRNRSAKIAPLILTRELDVNLSNAWLLTATGRDASGPRGYRLTVHVNGKQVNGTEGYNSGTSGYSPGTMDTVAYGLGRYVGQKVKLRIQVQRHQGADGPLAGLLWGSLRFRPVIADLPKDPKIAVPDITLESLKPIKVDAESARPSNSGVDLRFCRMTGGLVMPPGVRSVTYKLDKRWRRFVACVGPAGFSNGAMGAFQVLVDGNVLWTSKRFDRLNRARYVDIPLPKNGARLKLRVNNETRNKAVWANAGFKLKGK